MTIHLNIGSNIGNRMALIGRAVALLSSRFAPCGVAVSRPVESEPWGYESPNTFINAGVRIDTRRDIPPADVLAITREVELAVGAGSPHRNPDGSYCDRPIDIDIIAVDRLVVDDPTLTLPHPRAHLRDFVMNPLAELDPAAHKWLTDLAKKAGKAQP